MADVSHLQSYLKLVAQTAPAGEKLPTVRRLMQDFSLSQANVERVLSGLKQEGLIAAHVGRGTFFTGTSMRPVVVEDARATGERTGRSVILLRRSSGNRRGRIVLDRLQKRLADAGDVTLDVGYSNAAHARQVLQTLPRFDACVVQNAFDIMPIEMISAIRRKTDTIIVDGAWLVGTDVDAVGFEWGESIAIAVQRLRDSGHDHITLVTTQSFFLANELGLHRYRSLRTHPALSGILQPELRIPQLPTRDYEEAVVASLAERLGGEPNARRAIVVWGIESGAKFRALLTDAGFSIPDGLSVVLLGRTDLELETDHFFHVVGYSAIEQADGVFERLIERWQNPAASFGLRLMPVSEKPGQSIIGHSPDVAIRMPTDRRHPRN